jgi:hypothetical protein
VGPRAGLDGYGEQKVSCPPGLEPRDRPVRSESLSRRHCFFIDLRDTCRQQDRSTDTCRQQDRPTDTYRQQDRPTDTCRQQDRPTDTCRQQDWTTDTCTQQDRPTSRNHGKNCRALFWRFSIIMSGALFSEGGFSWLFHFFQKNDKSLS